MEQINLKNRVALILIVTAALVAAFVVQKVRLGQDLRGGTTLRFSLDLDRAAREGRISQDADREQIVADTIAVIRDRIDKSGLAEVVLTPLGESKFEILLPEGQGDIESIVDVVTQLGDLKFRIEVQPRERYPNWGKGTPPRLQQAASYPWPGSADEFDTFKKDEVARWIEANSTATAYVPSNPRFFVAPREGTQAASDADFAVLEEPEAQYRFDGGILQNPRTGYDERQMPVALYEVKLSYQGVFGEWTEANMGLPMAIILNERHRTAPTIQSKLTDNVQITLGAGTRPEKEREAKEIATVLQTGSLKVRPSLESRNKVGARLAGESTRRGILAVGVAFLLVLVFMVIYYRTSGLVADLALLLNVVLLVGTLAFFQAVLTLPGIAGIVLTVGMAVDANILINERIREERLAGRSLRRAVSEGYDRAFTTIIDANVTSLITAIFLYAYGSGPVRGFAITLAIGLVVSMFTSIYVTRTLFEFRIKRGWYREINMLGTGIPPKIKWVAMRRFFAPISVIGVVFGLGIFAIEDQYTLYDVDFTGGFKLQARFDEGTTVDHVQSALRREGMDTKHLDITIDVDVERDGDLRREKKVIQAGPYLSAEVVSVDTGGEGESLGGVEITVQRGLAGDDATLEKTLTLQEVSKAFEGFVREVLKDRLLPDWIDDNPKPFAYAAPDGEEVADTELEPLDGGMTFGLTLLDVNDVVNAERLQLALAQDMPYWQRRAGGERARYPASTVTREVVVRGEETTHPTLRHFRIWMKTTNQDGTQVENNSRELRSSLSDFLGSAGFKASLTKNGAPEAAVAQVDKSEPFPSVDVIGSTVAQKLKGDAMLALALSLLGIILYIAFRFQSRAMGFAAVLCLFHDVAITLGIVALANLFGIVDAKINLPMIAAFLTLVGYSVNDTVVVFDRIRENRGKKRVITKHMIDLSINQTLARTIKTSVTFLLACGALFAFNIGQRNVLEGFAFLLIIGSVVGTYSTVAIASPLLLYLPWLWERIGQWKPRSSLVTVPASKVSLLLLTPIAALLWLAWAIAFVGIAFVAGLVLFPVWALSSDPEGEIAPAGA